MKERRYYRLLQLTSLLYELQSQDRVRHDYKEEISSRLQSRTYTELLDLLIRQMTSAESSIPSERKWRI